MSNSFQRLSSIGLLTAGLMLTHAVTSVGQAPVAISATVASPPASMHPGDMLRVKIYREPELSGEYQVSERGRVMLPRLGEVAVADWPVDSLQPRLTRAFAEYLREPTIEVTVLRRISVTGAVLKPNLYQVDPTMSVLDALAMAGGAAPDGVTNRIELRREGQRFVANLDQHSVIGNLHLRSGDQLYVPQKSWLARNTWLVSTLIGATVTFTTVMVTR